MTQLPLFGKIQITKPEETVKKPELSETVKRILRDAKLGGQRKKPMTKLRRPFYEITPPNIINPQAPTSQLEAETQKETKTMELDAVTDLPLPEISMTKTPISKISPEKKDEKKTPVRKTDTKDPMMHIHETIVNSLRSYFQKNNMQTGIIGLSGGIDSSLTLKLAVDALGPENIFGVIMPEIGLTAKENIDHARELANCLGVKTYYQPINTLIIDFKLVPWNPNRLALMNSRARIRSVLLYSLANTLNGLVLGTSNKSEILLGYGTKYGDLAADIEVLGSLYKTEVYELAKYLGFSNTLLSKRPSAELTPGQTDEEDLGGSYKELDTILVKLEQGMSVEDLIDRGINPTLVHKVARLITMNKHKREMPPVIGTNL